MPLFFCLRGNITADGWRVRFRRRPRANTNKNIRNHDSVDEDVSQMAHNPAREALVMLLSVAPFHQLIHPAFHCLTLEVTQIPYQLYGARRPSFHRSLDRIFSPSEPQEGYPVSGGLYYHLHIRTQRSGQCHFTDLDPAWTITSQRRPDSSFIF